MANGDAAGDRARVEIEVAVRDSYSVALKEMAKLLDEINKKAREAGEGPTNAFAKFRAAVISISARLRASSGIPQFT